MNAVYPFMAHIGLTPQSVNVMGGFKTQGRTHEEWAALEADAAAVAQAGCFQCCFGRYGSALG